MNAGSKRGQKKGMACSWSYSYTVRSLRILGMGWGPLEEQQWLLTPKPPPTPQILFFSHISLEYVL